MATITRNYNSISTWVCDDVHLKDIDIGPKGDVYHGFIGIKGDRWKHKRIGFAESPTAKLYESVDQAVRESAYEDSIAPTDILYISENSDFNIGDSIYIKDKNSYETNTIDDIVENQYITVTTTLSTSYYKNDNLVVSTIPVIKVEKNELITTDLVGDWVEISSGDESRWYQVHTIDKSNDDYDQIKVLLLDKDWKKGNHLCFVNTSLGWTRNDLNPIIDLQKKTWWDYAGQNVSSPDILFNVDTIKDSDDNTVRIKNGMWIGAERENGDSQISLLLSKDEGDVYNWTDFLGDNNSSRKNPIIRKSHYMDRFDDDNYEGLTANLLKVWDTESGNITVTLIHNPDTAWMQIDYTGSGDVRGLMPFPINADTTTNQNNEISFAFKGDAGNSTEDRLSVTLYAADGTSQTYTSFSKDGGADQSVGFTDTNWSTYTCDISEFEGRKYLRGYEFTVTTAGSGVYSLDDIVPFMPPRDDEIIADPSIIAGKDEGGELNGLYACYYTGRKRPRQVLTSNATLSGLCDGIVEVSDTSDFLANDIGVIYNRDNYEIFKVTTINSSTRMTIEHVGNHEDSDAKFEYNYRTDNQSVVANNTYKTNKIYGGWVYDSDDLSTWVKYSTNENITALLEPGTCGDWDDLSVSQPCMLFEYGKAYMFYSGKNQAGVSKIGMAYSTNFYDFTKSVDNPFLSPTASTFDEDGCFHPDIIKNANRCFLMYTGKQSGADNIGSAIFENNFHTALEQMKVVLLVFPIGYDGTDKNYKGMPPLGKKSTLFDQGNFRIDVHDDNSLSAHVVINGNELSTANDPNITLQNAMGTVLVHNHWNLVSAEYEKGQIRIHNTKMTPHISDKEFFTRAPYRLTEDLIPGATSITIEALCDYLPAVTDYSGIGQDYMVWGNTLQETADDVYSANTEKTFFQLGRITSVTDNGDGTYDCDIDYPVGGWGISSTNTENADEKQGIMLAQGVENTFTGEDLSHFMQNFFGYVNKPTTDANKIFNESYIHTKTIVQGTVGGIQEPGYWWSEKEQDKWYVGGPFDQFLDFSVADYYVPPKWNSQPLLDDTYGRPPIIGNNMSLNGSWDFGFIGYSDIAKDILQDENSWEQITAVWFKKWGGRKELYNQMVNNSGVNKPKWHLFDLSGDGAEPDPYNLITRWILTDWDGSKFPGETTDSAAPGGLKASGIDLYLLGSAGTCTDGYLGRTMYMTNRVGDAAETNYFTDNFTKIACQLCEDATGRWDRSGVGASKLFKLEDQYHLAYTGEGRVQYPSYGEFIGDLFETSILDTDLTFNASFDIPTNTSVQLYISSEKKTKWIKVWDSTEQVPSEGRLTLSETYPYDPESENSYAPEYDPKYNVRFKLKLNSNSSAHPESGLTYDHSPVVRSFQVQYEDPGQCPSVQFLAEQNKAVTEGSRKGTYKVYHWNSSTDTKTDITIRIKEGGISNLTYQIPITPDDLGEIHCAYVNLTVANTDQYFYEQKSTSPFYNRNYMNDEILIYSGFITDNAVAAGLDGEYEVAGRFKISKIIMDSKAEAIIECRSIIRAALDTLVGEKVDGEDDPLIFDGKVKDIMESLLIDNNVNNCLKSTTSTKRIGAGIDSENVFIEDYNQTFNNIEVNEKTVADTLKKLAQATQGFIYTDNQGNVFFKIFEALETGTCQAHISKTLNQKNLKYTGQDYDRQIRKAIVRGEDLIEGVCTSSSLEPLNLGRDLPPIDNEYIQKQEYADSIANNVVKRYSLNVSEIEINTTYLPTVNIAGSVSIVKEFLDFNPSPETHVKYFIHKIEKNITMYEDEYYGISSFIE